MDLSQKKTKFSDAYLQAVAATAGYAVAVPGTDDDSVDWILLARAAKQTPRRPRVEVQLKCTARDILHEAELRFPLKLKNYNDLRDADVITPRILVVVTAPEAPEDWLTQTEEEMTIRHCAYWVSLRGMPETKNSNTVTIRLSRTNVFTPAALREIMRKTNDEETL